MSHVTVLTVRGLRVEPALFMICHLPGPWRSEFVPVLGAFSWYRGPAPPPPACLCSACLHLPLPVPGGAGLLLAVGWELSLTLLPFYSPRWFKVLSVTLQNYLCPFFCHSVVPVKTPSIFKGLLKRVNLFPCPVCVLFCPTHLPPWFPCSETFGLEEPSSNA